jgi:hypothetical protein
MHVSNAQVLAAGAQPQQEVPSCRVVLVVVDSHVPAGPKDPAKIAEELPNLRSPKWDVEDPCTERLCLVVKDAAISTCSEKIYLRGAWIRRPQPQELEKPSLRAPHTKGINNVQHSCPWDGGPATGLPRLETTPLHPTNFRSAP